MSLAERPSLPLRPAESHKGDYGRVLIVGGSRGMSGAACLAGVAALRGGAGLVRVAVPESVLAIVAGYEPSYLTIGLPEDRDGRLLPAAAEALLELAEGNDVVAIGPGLGRSPGLTDLVRRLDREVQRPMVIDADALNALADLWTSEPPSDPAPPAERARILTPHPGEFARLTRSNTKTVQSRRHKLAQQFAAEHQVIVVLKGHGTIVSDGARTWTNDTGNPGMATGGTGDVLTGLLAAMLAQLPSPFEAAQLAVHLHGLAGDLAAGELGQISLIASDLLRYLPAAFWSLEG